MNMAEDDPAPTEGSGSTHFSCRSIMVGELRRGASFISQNGGSDGCQNSERSGTSNERDISKQQSRRQSRSTVHRARILSEEEALAECVADAGLNTFGCVFVEVWALTDDGTNLTRPIGGHWMDPAFSTSLPSEILIESAWELDRIALDCPTGAGLAGTMAEEGGLGNRDIHWRQIISMLNDPFVQSGSERRMERLHEVGIGLVASVSFNFQEEKGIVLFYSRSTANVEQLRAASNERYMLGSTDLIGASYAIRKARGVSAALRRTMFREAIKKVKKELLHEKRSLASLVFDPDDMAKLRKEMAREAAQTIEEHPRGDKHAVELIKGAKNFGIFFLNRVKNSCRKWRGANLHGPPRQSISDCLFAFTGSFITMLSLLKIAKSIRLDSKDDFDAGWYSSTLCIIYALTPAPVGQPRQIFAAHLWNMAVGLACRQIPSGGFEDFMEWRGSDPTIMHGMPMIYVQALAVALGVTGQAFIGILHPPATGLSMTFASKSQWTWATVIAVMAADAVVVVISMMYLNLSQKKQYPLYWLGLGWQGSGGTVGFVRSKSRSVRRSIHSARRPIKSGRKMNGEEAV